MSNPCVKPGCTGAYDVDGYCDECGHRAPQAAAATGVDGSTPSRAGSRASSASGRSRATERGRLGAGLVDMPRMPVRDPASVVLTDPQVAPARRFCGNPDCERPVGRDRDGQPGLAEGFCPHCRTPFSFVPKLAPATLVGSRYEVLGCLAHGGLGWIYLARDKNVGDGVSDRWVVLKGLIDTGDPDAMAAAVTERRFLVEVDHPAIVKIHDFVSHPDPRTGADVGYIVMEYVGGRSLKDIRLERSGAGPAPLPLEQVIAYGLEILPAFGYLHDRDLLYCDFKPDNAIHTDDRLKLVDLGAVRRVDDDVSAVWGTAGYQAPEVEAAGPSVASDLYTVARTMAVLSLDFRGFSSTYIDRLPDPSSQPLLAGQESYYRLLRRATHPDPDRRFNSAADMAEQLLGVLRQVLAEADNVPRPAVSGRFTAERSAFGTAAGLVGLAAGLVGPAAGLVGPAAGSPNGALGTAPVFDGAAIAAALPVPQVDPADPGAPILLATRDAGPEELAEAARAAPPDSIEVPLALVRARIAAGDTAGARRALDPLGQADPLEWRVTWYGGLAALVDDDAAGALAAFDAVYDTLPGELAPQLALAAAAESHGDNDAALRRYHRVWRTDHGYVSAAFGSARILFGRRDHAGAVAVLDSVPASSSHHLAAQIAAARARFALAVADLSAIDIVDAAARMQRLSLDVERRASLTVELLGAALAWVRHGGTGPDHDVLGHRLTERDLRFGLERAYRLLAKLAREPGARIALVDLANGVRPRTLV